MVIGQVSDDYGISDLQVVFMIRKNQNNYLEKITFKNKLVDQFMYAFPDGITLEAGKNYEYYFEVFDNDIVNGKNPQKQMSSATKNLRRFKNKQKHYKNNKTQFLV